MTTRYARFESPVGDLFMIAEAEQLVEILFDSGAQEPESDWREGGRLLSRVQRQLGAYFSGRRRAFELPLAPRGTPFQRKVWRQLERIPYGATRSYAQLAKKVGKPTAFRAVGAANGQNPIPIVIPCHRVVGSDGTLTGFGGGLEMKRFLLEHESGAPWAHV